MLRALSRRLVVACAVALAVPASALAAPLPSKLPNAAPLPKPKPNAKGTKPAPAKAPGTKALPVHPYLAPLPSIHLDAYNSSVMDYPTPTASDELDKITRTPYSDRERLELGTCLNFMQDKAGNVYGFCGDSIPLLYNKPWTKRFYKNNKIGAAKFKLVAFDPITMKKLDAVELTKVGGAGGKDCTGNERVAFNLGYFTMDNQGRILIPGDGNVLRFYKRVGGEIKVVYTRALEPMLKAWKVKGGAVSQVVPAFDGGWYLMGEYVDGGQWGTFAAHITKTWVMDGLQKIPNERLENGMAVDKQAMYLLSDRALYKFSPAKTGLQQKFRFAYKTPANCDEDKTLSHGSGSTPTLMGADLVTFTDNADGRVNLVVLDRRDSAPKRKICEVPLFSPGKSENENTVIGYGNSIYVQNFAGGPKVVSHRSDELVGGFWRVDVAKDNSGCAVKWKKDYASIATARLSLKTGLIYMPIENWPKRELELAFIDSATGNEARPRLRIGDLSATKIAKDSAKLRFRKNEIMMMPIYALPDGRLLQPVFQGFKVISRK